MILDFGFWILDFRLRRPNQSAIRNPQSAIRNPQSPTAGFTLIEIMVALAILGMSAMVLLDAHYNALRLHADTRDQVLAQQFLEEAMGQAELQVAAGTLTGSGTFGKQYPDCSYSFVGQPSGAQQGIPLYEVVVSVKGLSADSDTDSSENGSMTVFVYNVGQ